MPEKHVWMVRAGDYNELIPILEEKSLVAIGWFQGGDWKELETRDDFKACFKTVYPEFSEWQIRISAGQCFRFARVMRIDDYVLSYDKSKREYLGGTVTGEYRYAPEVNEKYCQVREVNWVTRFSRDSLSLPAKNALGGALTVFTVDGYLSEIEALIKGEPAAVDAEETDEESVPYYEEVRANADELIADRISAIDSYGFQDLVAAVLRAMEFRTIISPPGPDRGVDIIAHPDAFGFQKPLIKVQVKHRGSAASGPDMRNFVATLRAGENGLFVSTGGFTNEAEVERIRTTHPIKAMDRDAFVDLLIEHYEDLEPEFKALIPLRKVYVPTGV